MCCITKAPKQRMSNQALYGESYICPASLSWINTEFGERQPTPHLYHSHHMWPLFFWRHDERCNIGFLSSCTHEVWKSFHFYCTLYPPTQHAHCNSHTSYCSWNRKLSRSFLSKLLSLASHPYKTAGWNLKLRPLLQICSQNTLYRCKREVDFGRLTQALRVWADNLHGDRAKRPEKGKANWKISKKREQGKNEWHLTETFQVDKTQAYNSVSVYTAKQHYSSTCWKHLNQTMPTVDFSYAFSDYCIHFIFWPQ